MKIMTFNLLCAGEGELSWKNRISSVVSLINAEKPDSLGVQEAHKGWIDALSAGLPDYDYVGVGRDDGKTKGEYSAVFYRKDRLEVAESDTFWISETPLKPSKGWDSACIRICTWAKLREKASGKIYVHMNTHLDHVGRIAQVNGARMICEKAASFGGMPVVCTGDFNVYQGSDCYECMVSDNMGDSKLLAAETEDCYTFHGFNPEKINEIIDFVFVDRATVKVQKYKVLNKKIDSKFYSDHNAVYAEVEI